MAQPIPIMTATSSGGDINLSGYPGLTYAPVQWGPGVRLAHNGTPIEDVVSHPDLIAAVATLKERAAAHGIANWSDICDAVRFSERPLKPKVE